MGTQQRTVRLLVLLGLGKRVHVHTKAVGQVGQAVGGDMFGCDRSVFWWEEAGLFPCPTLAEDPKENDVDVDTPAERI